MGNGSSTMSTSGMSSGPLTPSVGSYEVSFPNSDMRAPMASNPVDYSSYSSTISNSGEEIRAAMAPRSQSSVDFSSSSTPLELFYDAQGMDKVMMGAVLPVYYGISVPLNAIGNVFNRAVNNFEPGDDPMSSEDHSYHPEYRKHLRPQPEYGYANGNPPSPSRYRDEFENDYRESSRGSNKEVAHYQPEQYNHSEQGRSSSISKHPVSDYFGREIDPNRDNMQRAQEIAKAAGHLAEGRTSAKNEDRVSATYHYLEATREIAPIAKEIAYEVADAYVHEREKAIEGGYSQNTEICHQ